MSIILELLTIIILFYIFSLVGQVTSKKIIGIETKHTYAIGYIFLLAIFQFVSIIFLYTKVNTKWITLLIILLGIIIIYIGYIFFKNRNIYKYKSLKRFLTYENLIGLLLGLIIWFFASDNDQWLYYKLLNFNFFDTCIYSCSDDIGGHALNSLYLFNFIIVYIFHIDPINFVFGIYRLLEGIFIVQMFAIVNDLLFNSNKRIFILLLLGILGVDIVSTTPLNVGMRGTLYFGNNGTLLLMYIIPCIFVLILYLKRKNRLLLLLLISFSFACTTTMIPFIPIIINILYFTKTIDKKTSYYAYCLNLFYIFFFMPKHYVILNLILILIAYVILNYIETKDNLYLNANKIIFIIYNIIIILLTVFSFSNFGIKDMLLLFICSIILYFTIILFLYYKIYGIDNFLIFGIYFFIIFILWDIISSWGVLNTLGRRITICAPFILSIRLLYKYKKLSYLVILISPFLYVLTMFPLMIGAPEYQILVDKNLSFRPEFHEIYEGYELNPNEKICQETIKRRVYTLGTLDRICPINSDYYYVENKPTYNPKNGKVVYENKNYKIKYVKNDTI